MEMILNEYDMVVGAKFENGTIQDYIDEAQTFGLIRYEATTAYWFLYNDLDSPDDIKELYKKVIKEEHYIKDEYGEEMVVFNKQGDTPYETLVKTLDLYLDDELATVY
ncbi:hypothetical protein [Halarcobacter bivalviorum]|uniref:Uncharacterized protein n=1 Tax=Halarcobacter bivalviorum TaxID=663364 RepID=A0AAX2AAG8_9BACT|nr:hypothetical protein [Halarcobacter bivalviorum]AXH12192.1 hypothetical protein ABIV_1190 [Halarcobacter bivalviorum]RXK11297.1 hypothetical protein CRV05_02715 [Halarcobacter bivalviorum]